MASYNRVPEHMQHALQMYVEEGVLHGDFLHAVLTNDLVNAFGRADQTNKAAMEDWVMCLYNDIPHGCWGSEEIVEQWIEGGGLEGRRE